MLCRVFRGKFFDSMDAEKKDPPIIDLENIIKDYVWEIADLPVCCCCCSERCRRKGLEIKVNWSVIEREDKIEDFSLLPNTVKPLKPVQLFRTVFKNDSGHDQSFSFKTQRTTQSSIEMFVQQGLQIGGRLELSFPLITPKLPEGCTIDPDTFKPTSGLIGGNISWNCQAGEKMNKTETNTWGIDTNIMLSDGERAEATLEVMEATLSGVLKTKTIIRVISPMKVIPVDIVYKSTGEVIASYGIACKSLCKHSDLLKLDPQDSDNASFIYNGLMSCKAIYGVEQVASVHNLNRNISPKIIHDNDTPNSRRKYGKRRSFDSDENITRTCRENVHVIENIEKQPLLSH